MARIANPDAMLMVGSLGENHTLQEVARQARQKLERVAESLLR
jgi:hypothetical protein